MTRAAIAAALIVAFVALPLARSQCAASCEAHRHAADILAAGPTCHHAASANTVIGRAPTSCGYEHAESAFAAATGPGVVARDIAPPAAVPLSAAIASISILLSDRVDASTPPLRTAALALSSTLRI